MVTNSPQNQIKHGQIYLIKLKGFSSWPGMIANDGAEDFWRVNSRGQIEYFVQFFGDKYEFAWVTKNLLASFNQEMKLKAKASLKLNQAYNDAFRYFDLPIQKRIEYFYDKYLKHQSSKLKKNTSTKRKLDEIDDETETQKAKKFDEKKYLQKYNIKDCYVNLKRLEEVTPIVYQDLEEIVKTTQSFSNLNEITDPSVALLHDDFILKPDNNEDIMLNCYFYKVIDKEENYILNGCDYDLSYLNENDHQSRNSNLGMELTALSDRF